MTNQDNKIDITLLDKTFQIKCPPETASILHQAASYLDSKMREIRNSGRVIGIERIAIISALNISYELLLRDREKMSQKTLLQLQHLCDKISDALHNAKQLDLDMVKTS